MNIHVIRLREKQRLNRQKKELYDALYTKLQYEQTSGNNDVVTSCIMRLLNKDD